MSGFSASSPSPATQLSHAVSDNSSFVLVSRKLLYLSSSAVIALRFLADSCLGAVLAPPSRAKHVICSSHLRLRRWLFMACVSGGSRDGFMERLSESVRLFASGCLLLISRWEGRNHSRRADSLSPCGRGFCPKRGGRHPSLVSLPIIRFSASPLARLRVRGLRGLERFFMRGRRR